VNKQLYLMQIQWISLYVVEELRQLFLTVNVGNVTYRSRPRRHYTSWNYFKGVLVRVTVTVWWRHTPWNNFPCGFAAVLAGFRWSLSSGRQGTVPLGSYSRRMAADVVFRGIFPLPWWLPVFVRVHSTEGLHFSDSSAKYLELDSCL
jgi:hypothetical protein